MTNDNQDRSKISVDLLGQSGCRLVFGATTLYIDPYLSNSVQELDAEDLVRQIPIPCQPKEITDADWVLVTHDHIDHCDPHTLPDIAKASPDCRFIGPISVLTRLNSWGIDHGRLVLAKETWMSLAHKLKVCATPAEHPVLKRDGSGNLHCVGFILEYHSRRLYIAGDTSMTQGIRDSLMVHKPIAVGFLPVNEQNFFRARRGIVGNMSIREAFLLADEVGIEAVVPVHWDMFAINSVDPAEIEAVYRAMTPRFRLLMQPTELGL